MARSEENNVYGYAGTAAVLTFELADHFDGIPLPPSVGLGVAIGTGIAGQAADGTFSQEDSYEVFGSIGGAELGFAIGYGLALGSGIGTFPALLVGTALGVGGGLAGQSIGSLIYQWDQAFNAWIAGLHAPRASADQPLADPIPEGIPVHQRGKLDGSTTFHYDDPETGDHHETTVVRDSLTHQITTVVDVNQANGDVTTSVVNASGDLVPTIVENGGHAYSHGVEQTLANELSALDQIAEINGVRQDISPPDRNELDELQAQRNAVVAARRQAMAEAAASAAAGRGQDKDDDPDRNDRSNPDDDLDPDVSESSDQTADPTAPKPGESWSDENRTHTQAGPNTRGSGLQAPILLVRKGGTVNIARISEVAGTEVAGGASKRKGGGERGAMSNSQGFRRVKVDAKRLPCSAAAR